MFYLFYSFIYLWTTINSWKFGFEHREHDVKNASQPKTIEKNKDIWEHLAEKEIIFTEVSWYCNTWENHSASILNFKFKKTCVFHSHVATNLKELQFVLSITLHNNIKKILNSSTDDRSCVGLRAGCVPRFICCLLACRCAVEVCVTQAVSGSCDQKLSAQQLETTYITQLQCESKESYQAGQRAWHCRRKQSEFNRISKINRASCKTIHQIQRKQQVQIKYLELHVKIYYSEIEF